VDLAVKLKWMSAWVVESWAVEGGSLICLPSCSNWYLLDWP